MKWWKSSAQDAEAELEYERQFLLVLQKRQQLIDFWVQRQQQVSADITLCCFEKMGDFCHRHIVGRKVIERSLPQMWGGEVGLMPAQMSTIGTQNDSILTPTELNKGNGLTDIQAPHKTPSKEYYNFVSKSNTSQLNITKGAAAQTTVLETEQSTNETLGTLIVSTLTPVKSTTEHLTIPELLGGVKSYDYLPPGWENVEVIATVAIGTQVQVYNFVSRQWQPGVVKDYWEPGGFLSGGALWQASAEGVSGEYVAVFVGVRKAAPSSTLQ